MAHKHRDKSTVCGRDVPHPRGSVGARRSDELPPRTHCNVRDAALVTGESIREPPPPEVPRPGRPVCTAGREHLLPRSEGQAEHGAVMRERVEEAAGEEIVDPREAIAAAGRGKPAISADHDAARGPRLTEDLLAPGAREPPDVDGRVACDRDQHT